MFKNILILIGMCHLMLNTGFAAQNTNKVSTSAQNIDTLASINSGEDLRTLLLEFIQQMAQQARARDDQDAMSFIHGLHEQVQLLSATTLDRIAAQAPSKEVLQQRLQQTQLAADTAPGKFQAGTIETLNIDTPAPSIIEFPEPRTTIPTCAAVTSTSALATFTSWSVVRDILAGAKWECLETIFGENSSTACTAVNVTMTAFEFAYKGEEACLGEQRDANLTAVLETQVNIAGHLSEFIDATTSSRASQQSLDGVQQNTNQGLAQLDRLQASLSNDLSSTELDLTNTLSDIERLASELTNLSALADDILFRLQENQVDIEDAQVRVADIQQQSEEIRTDTQFLIGSLNTLQAGLTQLDQSVQRNFDQQTRNNISFALAASDRSVIRFQLPAAVGGELEKVREVVVAALTAIERVGSNTAAARTLLSRGEEAYNDANYFMAYDLFAQAYRSLRAPVQGIKQ